jgi:hypothetical protein
MAYPLARAGVLDLLEEAVHALRAAPLSTVVSHWIGSAPFALGLLIFWNDMTQLRASGTSDSTCAFEAIALTLLLLWMNCWRAVFAGRLHRQLGGRPELPWTRRRLLRLVSSQAFFGGTKPLAMALAAGVALPLPWMAAFYRSAAVLADREDLDLPQLMAKARKLAGSDQRQGWGIILLLTVLYLILLLNVIVLLAVLPQLVRMLTGYESVFSRGASLYVSNSLFWLAAMALAWMAFDPFTQAVYCLRSFHLESRGTGADLRAALRLVRITVSAALIMLVAFVGQARGLQRPLSPLDLDQSIRRTLQSPEYNWRLTPPEAKRAGNVPWLVTVTDRLADTVQQGLRSIGNAVDRLVDWLREKFRNASGTDTARPPGMALHWSVYFLIAALLALVGAIVWRLRRAKTKPAALLAAGGLAVSLQDENLLADRLPEEAWIALADSCARQADYRAALRALYLANLAWLGRNQWIAIHPGKTNREYELEMRRRAREFPEARLLFAVNVAGFERAWYGRHTVGAEDIDAFRQSLLRIKAAMTPAELAA